jgi:hypothetical protein
MSEAPSTLDAELEAAISRAFGDQVSDARTLLLCYDDKEANRVRRAIVSLSGGQLDELAYYVERANQDYRDVLYWAEYPDE